MLKSLAGPLPAIAPAPRSPGGRLAGRRGVLALAAGILALGALAASGLPATWFVTELAVPECDPGRKTCAVSLPGGGQLSLALGTGGAVNGAAPLPLRVAVAGASATGVEVSMVGVSMNMVETRTELAPAGEESWRGELALPACSSGPMDWQANVTLRGRWHSVLAPFRFRSGVP